MAEPQFAPIWIWPPVHKPEVTERLKARNLKCLRPKCGCTEWDVK